MSSDTTWFVKDRFGMFIHWGLYALGSRHEWLMHRESIPPAEYRARYFDKFDPDLYDPQLWADAADDAGMKYFVVTAKHHEGFCLWDSAHTDFKAPNTPAKRDLLKPMVDAFRSRGLRAGLYYSLLDWSHPDFLVDQVHGPLREAPNKDELNKGRDQSRYAAYMRNQVQELLTKYGDIDVLWFDFSYPQHPGGKGRADWESEKLVELIRKLRPSIILDDRLDLPGVGDIHTPEQFQPRVRYTVDGKNVVWEACQTLSGSWGYHRDEADWRDADELIRTLIDCVSKDGNLLLNVGPTSRGEFDERALSRLRDIGRWMKRHSRSIYGCGPAPEGIETPRDCRLTYNSATRRLYCHIFAWPYKHLYLDGLNGKVAYAQLLHDGSEVALRGLEPWQAKHGASAGIKPDTLAITLPQKRPDVAVPVVELVLK
jgi:alpha-L-fucosidase